MSLLSRVLPGGVFVNHNRAVQHEWLRTRKKNYFNSNSIFLENIYNKIGTDVGTMRFKHVKITRNTDAVDSWEWFEFSDLAQAVSISPNNDAGPVVFWSDVIRTMLEKGIAVVVPVFSGATLTAIHLAEQAAEHNQNKVAVTVNDEERIIDKSDVWIFENPKQNLTMQLGQMTKLIDENLRALSEKVIEPKSKIRAFLELTTMAADEDLKRKSQQRVKDMYEVAENGGIGFLQKGESIHELSHVGLTTFTSEDLELVKSQLYHAFGINEALFTCDYNEDQYRAYYQSVVKVYMRVVAEEINRKFFTKTARTQGQKCLVYMDLFDIASLKDLNEFAFKQTYIGNTNSNEVREVIGLPPYDGGDTYFTNKNAIPAELLAGMTNQNEGIEQ
ncbi:MAG: phage portal protein [Coriobacteriia bacterium]|nr:phage portal protein [Coriobacteriia bacterium]